MTEDERILYNKKKGHWWSKLSDEQKNIVFLKRSQCSSSLETKIAEILSQLNITYTRQKFINRISYDFLLSDVIAINNGFWSPSGPE